MTLRAEISIVPYGSEEDKYGLFRLDISNVELIENHGFGHEICKYDVSLFRHNNATIRTVLENDEWSLEKEGLNVTHDRRDGALALVVKAISAVGCL